MKISKRAKKASTIDYDSHLLKELKDLDYAAGYLTACLEEGEEVFLVGIRNVARAQGGMKALSNKTKLNRESLYDMLSGGGNPRLVSLTKVLDKLGFKLHLTRKMQGTKVA